MKKYLYILVLFLSFLTSCNSTNQEADKQTYKNSLIEIGDTISLDNYKIIDLDFGFKVIIGQEEDFDKYTTYSYFKLTRNNQTVYLDSSLTEYEFGDKLFPIILQTGKNKYELLFEINDRPSKNYLKRLIVHENKTINEDKLPTFVAKPSDLNNDRIKEYAGFWDYSQVWGGNNNLTAYNPIIYYSVTKTGLQLDSLLTKDRNQKIYGKFYGFSFNEKFEHPISVRKKFDEEIKLITN